MRRSKSESMQDELGTSFSDSYVYNNRHRPRSERPPTLVAYNAMGVLNEKFHLLAPKAFRFEKNP